MEEVAVTIRRQKKPGTRVVSQYPKLTFEPSNFKQQATLRLTFDMTVHVEKTRKDARFGGSFLAQYEQSPRGSQGKSPLLRHGSS